MEHEKRDRLTDREDQKEWLETTFLQKEPGGPGLNKTLIKLDSGVPQSVRRRKVKRATTQETY